MEEDGSGVRVSPGKLGTCEVDDSGGATSGLPDRSTVDGSANASCGGTCGDRLKGVGDCLGLCDALPFALPSNALITGVATSSCLLESSSKRRYVENLGQMSVDGELCHVVTCLKFAKLGLQNSPLSVRLLLVTNQFELLAGYDLL
jgi:hypothetical protein